MLTEKQKLKYYKTQNKIGPIIKRNVRRRGHIIYGARALNAHFPDYLDKHTEDYDIFSKTPRKTAGRVEKRLDKHYGGDYFYVEKALHPGTYKVKSYVTKRGIADYTKPEEKIPSKKIKGIKYVKLKWVKKKIKKTLKDKESRYRWDKDREALQRIKIYERIKKQRRNKTRSPTISKQKIIHPLQVFSKQIRL